MRKWEADGKVSGLGQLVLPSGIRTWYLRYRDSKGRQRFQKIARADRMNRTVAREQALQLLADVSRGNDQPAATVTMAGLLQLLEDRHYPKLRASTAGNYRAFWRLYVLPGMGQHRVAAVTRQDVLQLLAPIVPVQANRVLQMLRSAFNWAEVWGLRPENSNPCRRVPRHQEKPRQRYLSPDEQQQLLVALAGFGTTPLRWRFAQLVHLLLFTGARLNEIKLARWDWVNLPAGVLVIPPEGHKTGSDGRSRIIHLSPPARAVLQQLQDQATTSWVIAGQGDGPLIGYGKLWTQLLAAAGIRDLRPHDLRHHWASMAVSAGLSLQQIGGLLGHASPVTTARYAHLAQDQAQVLANQVAEQIKAPAALPGPTLNSPPQA